MGAQVLVQKLSARRSWPKAPECCMMWYSKEMTLKRNFSCGSCTASEVRQLRQARMFKSFLRGFCETPSFVRVLRKKAPHRGISRRWARSVLRRRSSLHREVCSLPHQASEQRSRQSVETEARPSRTSRCRNGLQNASSMWMNRADELVVRSMPSQRNHRRWCELKLADANRRCSCSRRSSLPASTGRPSLLGDGRLPGAWSADLVAYLGEDSSSARPLACAARRTASQLLLDSAQTAGSELPAAEALASSVVWGEREQAVLSRAEMYGGLVKALVPFSSIGVPAQAANHAAVVEAARAQRVDRLLAGLAQRVGSLSRRMDMDD